MTPLFACAAFAQEAPVVSVSIPETLPESSPPVAVVPDVPGVAVLAPQEREPRTVPFRITVVPGFGLAADPEDQVEGFSIGFLSYAKGLEGGDMQVVGSWVDGPMEGVQMSTFGNVAQEVDGAQLSSGVNWASRDVVGTQLSAGANIGGAHVRGFQGSSFLNIAGRDLVGVQGTAGVNIAAGEASEGVQAAAGLNIADGFTGVQAAPLNIARSLDGLQLGIVNIGGDVEGVQIGIVNIAKTSNVSIAPINLIGDGLHRLDVWASESAIGTAALKLGSKNVYTLLGVGWVNPSQSYWTFGGGFGVHLVRDPMWLEVDATSWSVAEGPFIVPGVHAKLRAQVGVDLADHLAPFAGLSMNTWTGVGNVVPRAIGVPSAGRGNRDGRFLVWPGFHAGVSF